MAEKEQYIDKVSLVYRESEAEVSRILKDIRDMQDKLEDKSMPYQEYRDLEQLYKILKQDYENQVNISKGISLAREALF